jgi:serine protease AprX
MQIANAIKQSASQYDNPDDMLGHGIPDFILANNILTVINGPDDNAGYFTIYPNPFTETFTLDISSLGNNTGECRVEIRDVTGRLIGTQGISLQGPVKSEVTILQNAPRGLYFAAINLPGNQFVQKIVKR